VTRRTLHHLAAIAACVSLVAVSGATASAEPPAAESPPSPVSPLIAPPGDAKVPAPRAHREGVAVVALAGAADAAWPLAQAIYAKASLKPAGLDEARARVLAGESPASDAPAAVRDLAETRAAIRGDDAPSRQLLASIATSLGVKAIVVVSPPPPAQGNEAPGEPGATAGRASGPSSARVFLADAAAFDAPRYEQDAPGPPGAASSWGGAVASLERSYGAAPPPAAATRAPAAALAGASLREDKGDRRDAGKTGSTKSFFSSPWFWGAIGAAVFGGAAVYLATRDNDPGTIHLQMQVPK